MKILKNQTIYVKSNRLSDQFFDDTSLFFDIETTGFSPKHTQVYLIGCAYKKESTIYIEQYFAETFEDEKEILEEFLNTASNFKTLISFNGLGFDIPFLKAKCEIYEIKDCFLNFEYLDIFKIISSYKFLLRLENYKQKTIETFLGINREDEMSGGELIEVYQDYLKQPDEEKFSLLQKHNYEDVLGMIDLLPILSYAEIFNGNYSITSTEEHQYTSYQGELKNELIITLKNDYAIPKRLSCQKNDFYLIMNQDETKITVPITECELKFFYDDYKNYFYLPDEDIAIHKSVATFVEKEYREKCKASNCYNRKTGRFLVQYLEVMHPLFKTSYKDKYSYFELTDDFLSSDIMLRRYIEHVFITFFNKK